MPLSSLRNSFRRKNKPQKLKVTENWLCENDEQKQTSRKLSPPQIFSKVGAAKALWSNKLEAHAAKQANNPFSDKYAGPSKLNKNDPNYGRPEENSLTAQRAKDGEAKLRQEVCDLCGVIFEHGTQTGETGRAKIQFGKLFQIYNGINDKVVGLLLRARKKHLLAFEGEMLFQRRDDDKWIVLTKNINSIHVYFGRQPNVVGGGEVEYDDPQISAELKGASSYTTLNSQPITADSLGEEIEKPDVVEQSSSNVVIQSTKPNTENKRYNNSCQAQEREDKIVRKDSTKKSESSSEKTASLTATSRVEKKKPKLSFRFRTKPESKNVPIAENVSSSKSPELTVPQEPREKKKSVIASLFDNLPIIPPRHVATANITLGKKKGTEKGTSGALPLKAKAALQTKRSKSLNENEVTVVSASVDKELESEVHKKMPPLSTDKSTPSAANRKNSERGRRRASIALAAATARSQWEKMKNVTTAINRMSLKSKSRIGADACANNEEIAVNDNGDNNNIPDIENDQGLVTTTGDKSGTEPTENTSSAKIL